MYRKFRRSEIVRLLEICGQKDAGSAYWHAARDVKTSGRVPAELKVYLTTFQLYLNMFSALSLLSFVDVLKGIGKDKSSTRLAIATLFPALANDGYAILTLCGHGFDVQARSLLRNFIEKADLAICVLADKKYADGYVDDSTFEGSRDFFFSHLARGKLKDRAISGFAELAGREIEIITWLQNEWRPELDVMLGAAVHPNHTVGFISLFPHSIKSRGEAVGLGGHPSNNSMRTILDAMRATLPLAALSIDHPLIELASPCDMSDETVSDAAEEVLIAAKLGVSFCTASWAESIDL